MWRSHHYDCIFLIFCEFTISSPTLLVIYVLWWHLFEISILQFLKLLSLFKKDMVMVSQFAHLSSSFFPFFIRTNSNSFQRYFNTFIRNIVLNYESGTFHIYFWLRVVHHVHTLCVNLLYVSPSRKIKCSIMGATRILKLFHTSLLSSLVNIGSISIICKVHKTIIES